MVVHVRKVNNQRASQMALVLNKMKRSIPIKSYPNCATIEKMFSPKRELVGPYLALSPALFHLTFLFLAQNMPDFVREQPLQDSPYFLQP